MKNGITFTDLLGLLFLALKLTNQIDWSWWWVTAPFWAAFLLIWLHNFLSQMKQRTR